MSTPPRTWAYTWSALGKIASTNGPKAPDGNGRDDVVNYSYDASGNLLTVTNGLGQVITYSNYDANGRPGQMVDRSGLVTAFTYDAVGRLLTRRVRHPTTVSLDAVTTFGYDLEGRLTSFALPETDALLFDYSPIGRLIAIRDSTGARIDYTYDVLGNRTEDKTTSAGGMVRKTIAHTFDDLGRMLTETLGPGRTKTVSYDANDNVTVAKNARNQSTQLAFDPLDRLVSDTDPLGNAAQTGYTPQDDVVSRTDRKSVQTVYVRNGFGEVIHEASPDRGTSIYNYDLAGDLVQSTDGRGQVVNYSRDVLGRLIAKTPVGVAGQTVTYSYDTSYVGRLATVSDPSGTTAYSYDHRGNVTGKAVAIAGVFTASVGYGYDRADRITKVTYPSGKIVDYARDTLGRISGVTLKANAAASATTLASTISYEPFGPIKSLIYGNGLLYTQDWGSDQRLYAKSIKAGNGTALWSKTYTYDADDNMLTIGDLVKSSDGVTMTYDARSRLTSVIGNYPSVRREDYYYDANDNRIKREQRTGVSGSLTPSNTANLTYAAGTNRVASVTDSTTTRTLSYDGRGNMSSELRNTVALTTSYDPYGRLTAYAKAGTSAYAMLYSGTDERVQVTVGTTPRRFVYDESGRLIGEYGATGTVFAEHVWLAPDAAEGGYEPLALVGPTTTSWVHGDHLGQPTLLTSSAGVTVNSLKAYPFGSRYYTSKPSPTTAIALPGQIIDVADRFYNKYRDYDPTLGRYLQADLIGLAGGDNLYGYVGGNPTTNIDPEGLAVIPTMTRIVWDEVQKQLDNYNYHLTCDRKAPAGLSQCELARWNYRQALSCQLKRQAWEDRWGDEASRIPHERALINTKQRLNNAAKDIKRYCRDCPIE